MYIQFITTGGTIDKIYFDVLSQFEVGDSQVKAMLTDALVDFSYEITPIMKKDSLDITDGDRATIRAHIEASEHSHFIITHGTDTMPETAAALRGIENKPVVLTGALTPARFRTTDAVFNIEMAVGAVQEEALTDTYAERRQSLHEAWNLVFSEDVSVVEGMQRGRASPGFTGGVFSPLMDIPTAHFHGWFAGRYSVSQA